MNTNDILRGTPILLPTRAASSGLAVNKTEYVVVDGMTSYVYIFSFDGIFKGAVPTLRPYRKLTYSIDTDSYYALGCDCGNEIYTLNCRFEETDRAFAENVSHLTDISLYPESECGEKLLLSSPHEVNVFSKSGIQITEIRKKGRDIFYNSFVKTECATAEGITKNCEEYVRLSVNCEETILALPFCVTLKNLFVTDGGGIYGFFSKNYVNNYVVPIYENDTVNSRFFSALLKNSF
ncbi:MAG: hypothetical protein E7614_05555 [Ruminococcaceae bacterium]|nr:hypothetical protein [Oscillospiraceae bacterium]